MELSEFKDRMSTLKINMEKVDTFAKALEKFCDTNIIFSINYDIYESYMDLLSQQMNDKSEFIDWYIYETNWGEKKMSAGYDGEETIIDTYEKLYNLIKL